LLRGILGHVNIDVTQNQELDLLADNLDNFRVSALPTTQDLTGIQT
jgi:hypothetical protein